MRSGLAQHTLGCGEFLGEIAFIHHGRTTATATTEGPARLFVLTHQGFNSSLDHSPAIRFEITTAIANRIRELERKLPTEPNQADGRPSLRSAAAIAFLPS